MYLRSFFQIIFITVVIVQCRAEDGEQPVLGLSGSTVLQRSSKVLNDVRKKEQNTSINHIRKRTLNAAATRLFDVATKAFSVDDDCCSDNGSSDDLSPASMPSTNPTLNPTFSEKKFFASDGSDDDYFGSSCSISNDLVVIGANKGDGFEGAAYLFNLDGTEVAKLTPNDGDNNYFGYSVSIDEKVVVGSLWGDYIRVYSHEGIYERTITCDDCTWFGQRVATLGNLIVASGKQDDIWKLFMYKTEGEQLKEFESYDEIHDVDISEEFIVSTASDGRTIIYSNTSPDFPKTTEINRGGKSVAVSNERLAIGHDNAYYEEGLAYLYNTDGTLVATLQRLSAMWTSNFEYRVAITDDKVLVGVRNDDDQGQYSGSAFIYSAIDGESIEKVAAPDGEAYDYFGESICAFDSYYVVGAIGDDDNGEGSGSAYLFQFSEE